MVSMKMARAGKNMTMVEMAKALDVHPQTYSAMEKNPDSISVRQAKEFCKIVGMSVDEIFFDDDTN